MILLTATLALIAPAPIMREGVPVAYRVKAERSGRSLNLVLHPHQMPAVVDAISAGGGQQITIRKDGPAYMLVASSDQGLKTALTEATAQDRIDRRAADPLGYARSDLAWAKQMLRCAVADQFSGRDVPNDWMKTHEDEVFRLQDVVASLEA